MKIGVLLGAALMLWNCSASRSIRSTESELVAAFAFANVNVVDVEKGTLVRNATVVVRGNRVVAVSTHRDAVPRGTTTTRYRGE